MRALWLVAASTMLLGCGARSIEPAETATPFTEALMRQYIDLADAERAEADFSDARLFRRKAGQASLGKAPEPDDLSVRSLSPRHRADLEVARDLLESVLIGSARLIEPETLARAQTSFDCWAQEAEEDLQPEEIEACRKTFFAKLAEVERIEAGSLVILLPSEDDSAIQVTRDADQVRLDSPYSAAAAVDESISAFSEVDKSETERVLSAALAAAPRPQRSYLVYFMEGSSDLTSESEASLQEAVADALSTEAVRVTVFGHTDRQGAASVNVRLARARAEAIRTLIVAAGVVADAIDTDSFGESFPLVPTADGVPEPRNRRVEITVR